MSSKQQPDNPLLEENAAASPERRSDQGIYRAIANAIFDQRLPSGTKLPEDNLGDIFSVSRTVVRKALYRLSSEKLVEIRPNRGARVAEPSVDEAREVFQSRRVVEAATVEAAIARMTNEHLERLKRLVNKDYTAHQDSTRRRWIRYSGAFHLEVAEIAGNQVLKGFLKELIGRTSLIIGVYEPVPQTFCTYDEHEVLLETFASGDTQAAVNAMVNHLSICEQRLGLERRKHDIDLREVFSDRGDVLA